MTDAASGAGPLWRATAPPDADREAAFQRCLETTVAYFAAVEANGDTPWFNSIGERRELFMRRFQRPAPPADMPAPRNLKELTA